MRNDFIDFYQVLWNGELLRYHRVGESGNSVYWTKKSMIDCGEFDEWKVKEVNFEEFKGAEEISYDCIANDMQNVFMEEDFQSAKDLSLELWNKYVNPNGTYRVVKFADDVLISTVAEGKKKAEAFSLAEQLEKENRNPIVSYEVFSESCVLESVSTLLMENGFKPIKEGSTIYEYGGCSIIAGNRKLKDVKSQMISILAQIDMVERMNNMLTQEEEKEAVEKAEPKKKTKKKESKPKEEAKPENEEKKEKKEEKEEEKEELPMDGEEEDVFKENTEPVDPVYVAESLKEVQTPIFRRLTLDGNRYYFRVMDDGYVKIYASGTNLIKDGYAENKDALNEWKALMKDLGKDPVAIAKYEADKGTIMHYFYGLYLMGRDIYLRRSFIEKTLKESDLRLEKGNMEKFLSSPEDIENMIDRIIRFAKFCSDYKVKPLLIEKILCLEEYEVASPVDLVCEMTMEEVVEGYFGETYLRASGGHKKGDPKLSKKRVEKKIYAIVDFKSGGIWPSYALQLEMYRRMVNRWYEGKINVEKIYNFSPKSESSKGYTLRDQTGSKEIKKADVVFAQGMINHQNKEKKYKMFVGKLNINEGYNEEKVSVTYDIAYELSKRFGNFE